MMDTYRYITNIDTSTLLDSSLAVPTMSYKGVDITTNDLDELVARKQRQKPLKPKPKERVVFDGDYTIYYDKYGKKTVVSKMPEDKHDPEKAVLYALLKSKGVKPKEVAKLIDNATDKKAKRMQRNLKKFTKASKQTAQVIEQLALDFDLDF